MESKLRAEVSVLCHEHPEIAEAIDILSDRLAERIAQAMVRQDAQSAAEFIREESRLLIIEAICIGMGGHNPGLADYIAERLSGRFEGASQAN